MGTFVGWLSSEGVKNLDTKNQVVLPSAKSVIVDNEVFKAIISERAAEYMPVYLELQEERIVDVQVPRTVHVEGMHPTAEGDVALTLNPSCAVHSLRANQPDFSKLYDTLRFALVDCHALLVTCIAGTTDVIDARRTIEIEPESEEAMSPQESEAAAIVNMKEAQHLFDLVASKSYHPVSAANGTIPFMYAKDGCWARAHEMYRLILIEKTLTRKLWLRGTLRTPTRNLSNCIANWSYHVAPIVRVSDRGNDYHVIDPSIRPRPEHWREWVDFQSGNANQAFHTIGTYYRPNNDWSKFRLDREYTQTRQDLTDFRNKLLVMNPRPPFNHCPDPG